MIVLGEQVVVVGAGAAVQDDHRRAMSHPSRVEADAVQLDRRFGGRLWHRVSTYTVREDEAASLTTRPTRARRRRDPLPSGRPDGAVPGAQYGARARGDPDDLHGAGVEPGVLLLQLAQGAAAAAAGRVQGRGMAPRPDLPAARGARRGAGARVERDAVDGGGLV